MAALPPAMLMSFPRRPNFEGRAFRSSTAPCPRAARDVYGIALGRLGAQAGKSRRRQEPPHATFNTPSSAQPREGPRPSFPPPQEKLEETEMSRSRRQPPPSALPARFGSEGPGAADTRGAPCGESLFTNAGQRRGTLIVDRAVSPGRGQPNEDSRAQRHSDLDGLLARCAGEPLDADLERREVNVDGVAPGVRPQRRQQHAGHKHGQRSVTSCGST